MAFVGLHVVCAYAGSESSQREPVAIMGRPVWSERLTSGGTTTKAAPGDGHNGDALFHLRGSADGYALIGPDPGAAGTPEIFVPVAEFVSCYVKTGDKLKWIPA